VAAAVSEEGAPGDVSAVGAHEEEGDTTEVFFGVTHPT
jgi:hypothetical protein